MGYSQRPKHGKAAELESATVPVGYSQRPEYVAVTALRTTKMTTEPSAANPVGYSQRPGMAPRWRGLSLTQ